MKKQYLKECVHCDTLYTTLYKTSKYCTSRCYGASGRLRRVNQEVVKPFVFTGKEFWLVDSKDVAENLDSGTLLYDTYQNQTRVIGYKK